MFPEYWPNKSGSGVKSVYEAWLIKLHGQYGQINQGENGGPSI